MYLDMFNGKESDDDVASDKELDLIEDKVILVAFEEKKTEVDEILNKVLSYPYPKEIRSIRFELFT